MAFIKLFRELWHYADAGRWKIVLYWTLHVLSYIGLLFQPYIFAQILNSFQGPQEKLLDSVIHWTIIWASIFVWYNICHRSAQYFVFNVAYRTKQRFLNEHYAIVTRLPMSWHTEHHSGDTINRINTAANALGDFSARQFLYVEYLMMFWGPLVALWALSWQVALITLVVALSSIVIMRLFDKRLVLAYREINERKHKVSAVFFDYVSNIKTIITLRAAGQTRKELDHQIEKGYPPYIHAEAYLNQWKWLVVSGAAFSLRVAVVFYYIMIQISRGSTVMVGNIVAVFQYLESISRTYMSIAVDYQALISWTTDLEAVKPIRHELREIKDSSQLPSDWENVGISGLAFSYQQGKQTLNNVSFSFRHGEKIALIGESGSGKSTLMALLRGLYTPDCVKMTVDGQSHLSLDALFETTTLIPQDPEIFENTIRYNITFGVEMPDEHVHKAVHQARFTPVIERLAKGLDADMRERGVTLSGGEKQRLALARGLLAANDSTLILMDEPTSSVDTQNEMEIYDILFNAFADKTLIASIHRLHLLSQFDRIIVMDEGRIVQDGSFAFLKAQDGLFKELWARYQAAQQDEDSLT
jgi:ABC-type multidrug transport system fused ATPase/permease subunit